MIYFILGYRHFSLRDISPQATECTFRCDAHNTSLHHIGADSHRDQTDKCRAVRCNSYNTGVVPDLVKGVPFAGILFHQRLACKCHASAESRTVHAGENIYLLLIAEDLLNLGNDLIQSFLRTEADQQQHLQGQELQTCPLSVGQCRCKRKEIVCI